MMSDPGWNCGSATSFLQGRGQEEPTPSASGLVCDTSLPGRPEEPKSTSAR